MSNELPITGQIFFRDVFYRPKGAASPAPEGKKLMMFIGVVAIPEDTEIKGEHQYTIVGREEKSLQMTGLTIMNGTEQDLTKQAAGYNLDSVLRLPLWRV